MATGVRCGAPSIMASPTKATVDASMLCFEAIRSSFSSKEPASLTRASNRYAAAPDRFLPRRNCELWPATKGVRSTMVFDVANGSVAIENETICSVGAECCSTTIPSQYRPAAYRPYPSDGAAARKLSGSHSLLALGCASDAVWAEQAAQTTRPRAKVMKPLGLTDAAFEINRETKEPQSSWTA